MLKKSFVFMMLLVASLITISGAAYHQMDVAKAQPQPQQPQQQPLQQQGQIQLKPQSPIAKGPVAQKQFETAVQALADKQLLDRLFPQIIKRMDGKTLATKVLPYLDITASVSPRQGTPSTLNVNDVARDLGLTGAEARGSTAKCNDGEIAVSGGFSFRSDPEDSYVTADHRSSQENGWYSGAMMGDNGKIQAFVTCLTINVALKDAQQPQQPQQQPSPPPGGPPLQPPSNLR
jgi:hypothetical protein